MIRSFLFFIFLALIAFGTYVTVMGARIGGAFVALEERLTAQCERVRIAPGAEDIVIDRASGIVFVSAADRRAGKDAERGGVYVFNASGERNVWLASQDAPEDFQPHGIDLWEGENGEKRLFAVNHPLRGGHAMEIFDVAENGALTHLETVTSPAMISPNDVAAVGARTFYFTNDRGFTEGRVAQAERKFMLPLSNAYFFDGAKALEVAQWLNAANGIDVSLDEQTVYIAEAVGRKVGVYARNMASGALTKLRSIPIATNPDNIDVAPDGAIWIGAHPKIFEYLKHVKDMTAPSPSQVLRLDPSTGALEDVLVSANGAYSASTIGAAHGDAFYVGSVFDDHILACPTARP